MLKFQKVNFMSLWHGYFTCIEQTWSFPLWGLKFQWSGRNDDERFWSTGVWEYWSIGKSQAPTSNQNYSFHYSITPTLHYSRKLSEEGKTCSGLTESQVFPPGRRLGLDSLFAKYVAEKMDGLRGEKEGIKYG